MNSDDIQTALSLASNQNNELNYAVMRSDDIPTTSSKACRSSQDEELRSTNFHKHDIGQYIKTDISDELKEALIRRTWTPDSNCLILPQIAKNGRKPYFQIKWLQQFSWLCYSSYSKGAFCKTCVLFANKQGCGKGNHIQQGALVTLPFQNWKDALEAFHRHSLREYHKESTIKAQNFLATFDDYTKSLESQLNKQTAKTIEEQTYKLKVIIETILLCGRQDISLRGHRDFGKISVEEPLENDGNFRALLRYRAFGDEVLKQSLEKAPKNATYCSPYLGRFH